jgi:hypothetical protein
MEAAYYAKNIGIQRQVHMYHNPEDSKTKNVHSSFYVYIFRKLLPCLNETIVIEPVQVQNFCSSVSVCEIIPMLNSPHIPHDFPTAGIIPKISSDCLLRTAFISRLTLIFLHLVQYAYF